VEVRLLLDTNALTALWRGHPGVAESVRNSERVVVSAVVAGELLYGFRAGSRLEQNLARLNAFLDEPRVDLLEVGWETADRFGRVMTALRKKGRPLPTNDVWIAAHALESGAHLMSFDGHFGYVDGLAWVDPGRSS
jgi:tRNA(fMet)-specific endonuclease VapC